MLQVRFEMGLSPHTQQPLSYAQWVQQKPLTEWRLLKQVSAEVPSIVRATVQIGKAPTVKVAREYTIEFRVWYEITSQNDWGIKRWILRLKSQLELPVELGIQRWWWNFESDWDYWMERGWFISRLRGEARLLHSRKSSWYKTDVPVSISLG